MKKGTKIILISYCLFFLISIKVNALTYDHMFPFSDIKDIVVEPNYNIMLEEKETTRLIKTDLNGNILTTKEFSNLKNANIIKCKDSYVLVGNQDNKLIIRKIDEYLRPINTLETTIILPNSKINLYQDKKNIYLILTKNRSLASRTIYVLDEDFTLKETSISAIKNVKGIVKSDYYLLEENLYINENEIIEYFSSTYKDDNIILVGNKNKQAYLTIKKEGEEINKVEENYENFFYTTILNDTILTLAKKENNITLLVYDLEGIVKDEFNLEGEINEFSSIRKGQNKIYVTTKDSVLTFTYEIKLEKEENRFGTIEIEGEIEPFNKIKYNIIPNSGYKVKQLVLKNDQGDILESKEEYFIMPNTNAYLSVVYEETVKNPNTMDPIFILLVGIIILVGIGIKLYKKYTWLKD